MNWFLQRIYQKKNTWVESEDDGNEIQIHDHLYQKYLVFKKRKE